MLKTGLEGNISVSAAQNVLNRVSDDKLGVTRERGALGMEMTVFAKAWLCEIACCLRECRVPCGAVGGPGDRLCDFVGGGAGRLEDGVPVTHGEQFVSHYCRVSFRTTTTGVAV